MPREWIGIVMAPPQVGAPLVIGRPGDAQFRITSPVTRVVNHNDMLLVTTGTSRYVIGLAGNTYAFDAAQEDTVVGDHLARGTIPPPMPDAVDDPDTLVDIDIDMLFGETTVPEPPPPPPGRRRRE